jgi:hypothetical protein
MSPTQNGAIPSRTKNRQGETDRTDKEEQLHPDVPIAANKIEIQGPKTGFYSSAQPGELPNMKPNHEQDRNASKAV